MRVIALDVSKGKSYVVVYEEGSCVKEWEIKHNQEGFNQLRSQLGNKTDYCHAFVPLGGAFHWQ